MNEVKLSGIVSGKIKKNKTRQGMPVVGFLLLIKGSSKHFINISAFGQRAEELSDLHRGDKIEILGHLQQEKWNSNSFDKKLSKLIVVIDEVVDAVSSFSK